MLLKDIGVILGCIFGPRLHIRVHSISLFKKKNGPRSAIGDPEVVSSIPTRSHTFVEVDREIFSSGILLLPLIQEGLMSATSESMSRVTKYWLTEKSSWPRNKCG